MRVWVAGLTIGGAVNKAQNSTVSAFLYAVSGTSDLLVVPSQYFYFTRSLMTSDAMISPTTDGTNAVVSVFFAIGISFLMPESHSAFLYHSGIPLC